MAAAAAMVASALLATVGEARRFGRLAVGATNILFTSPCGLAVAYANLQPILPGHILVAPTRAEGTEHMSDLTTEELDALFATVHSVQEVYGPSLGATAHNLAIHDGACAGQPTLLPHAHVHVVPRVPGDLANNDEVYERVQRWSPDGPATTPPPFHIPTDEERKPRTAATMAEEACRYHVAAAEGPGGGSEALPAPTFGFGPKIQLDSSQLFYASALSVASVNLKPLCPGHVLVIPRRCVQYMGELTEAERVDLWRTVRTVQEVVCRVHGAKGCKIGVQDGRDAGQSVAHVHVHLLPQAQRAGAE